MDMLTPLERRLLDEFQRDLPLVPAPYAEMARRLGTGEDEVLRTLADLAARGYVSRVGAVFAPHALGDSMLAALSVPAERLDTVADLVSGYPQVNHNYQREHVFNLWFVVTAESRERVERTVDDIEERTGLEALRLPLERPYHIDLGFPLWR